MLPVLLWAIIAKGAVTLEGGFLLGRQLQIKQGPKSTEVIQQNVMLNATDYSVTWRLYSAHYDCSLYSEL